MRHGPSCGCPFIVRALISHCLEDLSLAELAQLRTHVDDALRRKITSAEEDTPAEVPRPRAHSKPDPDPAA